MPTLSVRMTERDDKLIKEYAEMHNISVSDLIRNAVIEKKCGGSRLARQVALMLRANGSNSLFFPRMINAVGRQCSPTSYSLYWYNNNIW